MKCPFRFLCCIAVALAMAPAVQAADGDFASVITVNASPTASTNFLSTSDVEIDADGNLYYIGSVQNTGASAITVDLDPGAGTNDITVAASGYTQYAVKLDAAGVFQWGVQYAAQNSGAADSIEVDSSGNVYIAGSFAGTQDFNPQGGTANLTGLGGADAYLLKLDSSGTYQWAARWGNADQANPGFSEYAAGIGFDASDNPVVCGRFTSAFDADPGASTVTLNPAAAGDNVFLVGLDASGAYQWAKAIGGTCVPRKMISDASGDLYIAGQFSSSTTDFDPDGGTFNLAHNGSADCFLARYTGAGELIWAAGAGSSDDFEYAADLTVDSSGNVYATGRFRGDTDFDPGSGTFTITHSSGGGTSDVFVWKLDSSGGFGYARAMQSTTAANEEGTAIGVDGAGNVLVGGTFQGTVDFDPGTGTQFTTGTGGVHMFLARLDSSGDYLWHGSIFGSGFSNNVSGIQLTQDGHAYIAGNYQGTPDFDMRSGTQTRSPSGTLDGYLLALGGLDPLVITESDDSTAVTEGGATDTYTIELGFPNTGDVTVQLTPSAQLDVGQGAGTNATVTFTTAANDWATPRTITVTAADDFIIEGPHAGTIAHAVSATADPVFTGATGDTVNVDITDNDVAGLTVSQSGGSTDAVEGGAGDAIEVALQTQPLSPVTVTLTPDADIDLGNGPGNALLLNFPANATAVTPQTVTVVAADDLVYTGNRQAAINIATSSADASYNGLAQQVDVNIEEDEPLPALLVSESGGSTTVREGGLTDTFTVALSTQPLAAVTVDLQPTGELDLGAGAGALVQLSFPASALALTPQTVTVTAFDDNTIEGAHQGTIDIATASADANYASQSAQVTVDIVDNDTPTCDNPAGCTPALGTEVTVEVAEDVCLRVPDPVLANTAYTWRRDGEILVEGRYIGTTCRTLSIPTIAENEGGTYTCTYDDGSKAPATYTVVVTVVPVDTMPAAGLLGLVALGASLAALGARRHGERRG